MPTKLLSSKRFKLLTICFTICLVGCSTGANVKEEVTENEVIGIKAIETETGKHAQQATPDNDEKQIPAPSIAATTSAEITSPTIITSSVVTASSETTESSEVTASSVATASSTATTTSSTSSKSLASSTSSMSMVSSASSTSSMSTTSPAPVESTPNTGEEVPVIVIVSGKRLVFDDRQPVSKDGEVFVPVYGVFEYLDGANGNKTAPFAVNWDEQTSAVTIKNQWYTVVIASGEQDFTCNGDLITPAAPQQTIDGVFMLPLTAVANAIEATVEWDEETNTISIFYESMIITG